MQNTKISEKQRQIEQLSNEMLDYAKSNILAKMKYLDLALFKLKNIKDYDTTIASNGLFFYYSPLHVLKLFSESPVYLQRGILHTIFHCIFNHMFVGKDIDLKLWDIACDIAIENTLNELNIDFGNNLNHKQQTTFINELSNHIDILTAEKIYKHLKDSKHKDSYIEQLKDTFKVDEHKIWYEPIQVELKSDKDNEEYESPSNVINKDKNPYNADDDNQIQTDDKDSGNSQNQKKDEGSLDKNNEQENKDNSQNNEKSTDTKNLQNEQNIGESALDANDWQPLSIDIKSIKESWKEIAEKLSVALEMCSQGFDKGQAIVKQLNHVTRERYDYTEFLKKFAVLGEAMTINDDEFDYNFYTYGLKLYKNMPLIEPLEYKDVKRIKEFVIAIDTSGSTYDSLVEKFLTKTFNMLKTEQSFFTKLRIHIIQCDDQIRHYKLIENKDEFDGYIKEFKIHGCGGTDFRPVFEYIDKLVNQKVIQKVNGLIYLTDGFGTFPRNKPHFKCAFVFVESDENNYNVPSWAIKLILDNEKI